MNPFERFERMGLAMLRARGFDSRHVSTAHGDLHVLELAGRGEGPPVLLLHGLGSCAMDLAALMRRLSGGSRRLLALDLPGHGHSDPPAAGMTPRHLEAMLEAALPQVLSEPAITMGSSLGGLVSLRLADRFPDLVAGLVLAAPGGAPMTRAELDDLFERFRLDTLGDALRFVDRFLGRPHPLRLFLAMGSRARFARPEISELISAISPADLLAPEELQRVDAPTLVVWGPEDGLLPAGQVEFFRTHLPTDAQVISPPGYGHVPYLDQLPDFVQRVRTFMASVPAQAR